MIDLKIWIEGLEEAQAANRRAIAELTPARAFGRALQYTTVMLFDYAVAITHRLTGALAASHRMKVKFRPYGFEIRPDPHAVGPRGRFPAEYGIFEHRRGGEHAFYDRTYAEMGGRALQYGIDVLAQRIE